MSAYLIRFAENGNRRCAHCSAFWLAGLPVGGALPWRVPVAAGELVAEFGLGVPLWALAVLRSGASHLRVAKSGLSRGLVTRSGSRLRCVSIWRPASTAMPAYVPARLSLGRSLTTVWMSSSSLNSAADVANACHQSVPSTASSWMTSGARLRSLGGFIRSGATTPINSSSKEPEQISRVDSPSK